MATDSNGAKNSDKKKLTGNYEITLEGHDGETLSCTLKPPNRFVVQAAMASMVKATGNMDMIAAGEIVFNSCKIKCDKGIEEDDVLLTSVWMKCFEIIEIKTVELKKV